MLTKGRFNYEHLVSASRFLFAHLCTNLSHIRHQRCGFSMYIVEMRNGFRSKCYYVIWLLTSCKLLSSSWNRSKCLCYIFLSAIGHHKMFHENVNHKLTENMINKCATSSNLELTAEISAVFKRYPAMRDVDDVASTNWVLSCALTLSSRHVCVYVLSLRFFLVQLLSSFFSVFHWFDTFIEWIFKFSIITRVVWLGFSVMMVIMDADCVCVEKWCVLFWNNVESDIEIEIEIEIVV